MEAYPEAKVHLNVRAPESWYESTRNTIYNVRRVTSSSKLFRFVPVVRCVAPMVNDLIWEVTFDDRFEDRRHAI